MQSKAIIFDTETTGTDDTKDQIIEAAWLTMPPLDQINDLSAPPGEYLQRFKPSVPITYGAQAVHHIIHQDLVGCPPSEAFELPDGTTHLVGHNVDFDWRMAGKPDIKRICTLALSRFLFPDLDSHTQSAMIYFMARLRGHEVFARSALKNAHAALDDVKNCRDLLEFLLLEIESRDDIAPVKTWDELHVLSETARLPLVMSFGKHKGTPIYQVPADYVRWYRRQDEPDPYYLEAFRRCGM